MRQASFLCPQCNQMRLFEQQSPNHILHLLISLLLCGLWLPVWFVLTLANETAPFRCTICGYADKVKYLADPYLRQKRNLGQ